MNLVNTDSANIIGYMPIGSKPLYYEKLETCFYTIQSPIAQLIKRPALILTPFYNRSYLLSSLIL